MPLVRAGENNWEGQGFPEWAGISHCMKVDLPAGHVTELHYHDFDEYWLVLSGGGTARSEGRSYELRPGDLLLTRRGDEHDFRADEPTEIVCIGGPPQGEGRHGHLHRGRDD